MNNENKKNAIILAAGFGLRMIPINKRIPKGLLVVNGEVIIERLINQLHEVGITDITVIVGFMKESYEYLIDKFNVSLVVNMDYKYKHNLHSLEKVRYRLNNTYIVPCDIYCVDSPFSIDEDKSWYMISDKTINSSSMKLQKNNVLEYSKNENSNTMIGIAYLTQNDSKIVKSNLDSYSKNAKYDDDFWEITLLKDGKYITNGKLVSQESFFDINTYDELRSIDKNSKSLISDELNTICRVFNCDIKDIKDIKVVKEGMTNNSFSFSFLDKSYIFRIPGSEVNRKNEYITYRKILLLGISDEVVFFDEDKGYKISVFWENSRNCDPYNFEEVKLCMDKLKILHNAKIEVDYKFDLFQYIEFYESLWKQPISMYKDYEQTKRNILSLKEIQNLFPKQTYLCHIDACHLNFLFIDDSKDAKLLDWEYAGAQDPHMDLAEFCLVALYDKVHVDKLIDIYFENNCPHEIRIKIYGYIAICGLMWSNWCEYKSQTGIEFGEYALRQYRYAKDYYKFFKEGFVGV